MFEHFTINSFSRSLGSIFLHFFHILFHILFHFTTCLSLSLLSFLFFFFWWKHFVIEHTKCKFDLCMNDLCTQKPFEVKDEIKPKSQTANKITLLCSKKLKILCNCFSKLCLWLWVVSLVDFPWGCNYLNSKMLAYLTWL